MSPPAVATKQAGVHVGGAPLQPGKSPLKRLPTLIPVPDEGAEIPATTQTRVYLFNAPMPRNVTSTHVCLSATQPGLAPSACQPA